MSQFRQLVREKGADYYKISSLWGVFEPVWQTAYDVLEQIRKSPKTEELAELDAKRDELFSGLKKQVEGLTAHFDTSKRKAANNLLLIFDKYGRIDKENYNKETGSMTNFIQDMRVTYASDTALTGLLDWVVVLSKANEEFNTLYLLRGTEDGNKSLLAKMVDVRREGNAVYLQIVERLNALIIVEGAANYRDLVIQWNAITEKYRNLLAQREGRRAKENEVEINNNKTL